MPSGLQAIRDGVIEASINHEKGYVQSKEMIDIYSTREPQLAFHQRISFCLDIHNMSVKVSLLGSYWEAVGALGAPLEGGDGSSSGCDGAGLSEGDSGTQPRHFGAHGFSLVPPGHEVPPQILQQGLGICRGELSPGALMAPGRALGALLGSCCARQGRGRTRLLSPACPHLRLLLSRSAGSASSRTWSSQRKWQRTTTTASPDPSGLALFFYLSLGKMLSQGSCPPGPPRSPLCPFFYKNLHVCPRGWGARGFPGPTATDPALQSPAPLRGKPLPQ